MAKTPFRSKGRYAVSRGAARCYYCKCGFNWDDPSSEFYPTREHKQPRSKGGGNGNDNVVYACRSCNSEKGAMTLNEYREYLEVTKGCRGLVARRLRWKKHVGLFHQALEAKARSMAEYEQPSAEQTSPREAT